MKNNEKQTQAKDELLGAVNPKATAVLAAQQLSFPNEFKKSFWESIDKRYASILLATFVVIYGGMFLALISYVPPSQADLNAMAKQQYMNKILKQSASLDIQKKAEEEKASDSGAEEAAKEVVEEKTSTKGKTREETQSKDFQAERAAAASAAKEAYQQQVAAQASAMLATLSGRSRTGRVSSAGSAADVLGGATGTTDLGSVLAGATGKDAASGLGLANASRADIGRGGGVGGAKLGAVGAGTGLGAGSGVGDALSRGGKIKASLATGKVKSTGASSRSVEELTGVIDQHQRAVQACYEQEKVKDPSLKGQVVIELRIGKDGRVVGPRVVSSTMKNPNVERCILNKVRLWQFSAVTDPAPQVLNVPYVFAD
ncbi:MAG: AgmX/PglI C-terminal domain-containing protein [Bacteroidetes bacterium]|nr:AgmX/PglI C-terminal domain-containing protein [Bacteroidota bacterium]